MEKMGKIEIKMINDVEAFDRSDEKSNKDPKGTSLNEIH